MARNSAFNPKYLGDVILFGPHRRPHKIVRRVGRTTVVLQEMARDKVGRLRSVGEEGRFSSTFAAVQAAPLLKRRAR